MLLEAAHVQALGGQNFFWFARYPNEGRYSLWQRGCRDHGPYWGSLTIRGSLDHVIDNFLPS